MKTYIINNKEVLLNSPHSPHTSINLKIFDKKENNKKEKFIFKFLSHFEHLNWFQMHEEINLELENEQISCVSHNSLLNCLFVITSENKLILYDCNSKTRIKYFDWNKTLEKNSKLNFFFLLKLFQI